MQKHLQIVSGPAYETKSEYFVKYEHIPTLTVPHRAFYSGRMNIPFMPLWTCSDLLKNHTQIFLQCLPHTHIHTQHMCICLLYNADRQLGWMSLTKWSSVNMFQKDLVSLLKHRGSLVAKWSHVYPYVFFFTLEYVYWFCWKIEKKNSLMLHYVAWGTAVKMHYKHLFNSLCELCTVSSYDFLLVWHVCI